MQYVAYPFCTSISDRKPFSNGIAPLPPGNPVDPSVIHDIAFEWWLRPVKIHERVGEQSAVVCMLV